VNIYIHDLTTVVLSGGQRPLYLSVWMSLVTCVQFNYLRTSVIKGRTQKLHKKLRLSKPTDITIHWKALEENFLMVPLFPFNQFWGKMYFLNFLKKLYGTLLIFPGHIFITRYI
jgi:hypothetical protein